MINLTNENKASQLQLNCHFIKITSDMKILCIDIFDHIVTLRHTDVDSFFIVHGRQCILTVSCVVTSVVSAIWYQEVIVYVK